MQRWEENCCAQSRGWAIPLATDGCEVVALFAEKRTLDNPDRPVSKSGTVEQDRGEDGQEALSAFQAGHKLATPRRPEPTGSCPGSGRRLLLQMMANAGARGDATGFESSFLPSPTVTASW